MSEFKKINIFVGSNSSLIHELFPQIKDKFIIMHLGSKWNHTDIKRRMCWLLDNITMSDKVIFAYVNSLEVIQSLPKIINDLDIKDDFQMIRIGKSSRTSNKDSLIATYISCDELEAMIEMNLEMR